MLALVVTTTQASATLAAHRINFVNKNDAGRVFLRVFEHVTHTRRTHTHKHLNKVGTRNAEKWHLGFAGNAFRQQGFTRTGGAYQQQPTGDATTESLETLGVTQEVNDLTHLFFGFITAGNVRKGNVVVVLVHHAGLAFPKAERTAFASALHLTHEINPYTNEQQHGTPTHQQGHEEGALFTRLHIELHAVVDQVTNQAAIQIGRGGSHAPLICGDRVNLCTAAALGNGRGLDALGLHLGQEF